MTITPASHITLRAYNVDSIVHVLCSSYGFNLWCLAGNNAGEFDEPIKCTHGKVVDVYSVTERELMKLKREGMGVSSRRNFTDSRSLTQVR